VVGALLSGAGFVLVFPRTARFTTKEQVAGKFSQPLSPILPRLENGVKDDWYPSYCDIPRRLWISGLLINHLTILSIIAY